MHVDGGVEAGGAAAVLVNAEGKVVKEGMGAELAAVEPVAAAVETAVQFQVDVLRELGVAQLAMIRFLSRVQPKVRFQVTGAAEALVAHLEDMKRFSLQRVI